MALEFASFDIGPIGDLQPSVGSFAWVPVYIRFHDTDLDAYPSVEIKVPMKYERSWTIDEVRAAAYEAAKKAIAVTSQLFSNNDMAGMQNLQEEKDRASAEESAEARRQLFGE